MRFLILLATAVAVAGCAVGPNYRAPETALPAAYSHTAMATEARTNAPKQLAEWWTVFHDEQLNALIREAASSNLDLRIAESRGAEAKALRGMTRSSLFPQIGVGGDYGLSHFTTAFREVFGCCPGLYPRATRSR